MFPLISVEFIIGSFAREVLLYYTTMHLFMARGGYPFFETFAKFFYLFILALFFLFFFLPFFFFPLFEVFVLNVVFIEKVDFINLNKWRLHVSSFLIPMVGSDKSRGAHWPKGICMFGTKSFRCCPEMYGQHLLSSLLSYHLGNEAILYSESQKL